MESGKGGTFQRLKGHVPSAEKVPDLSEELRKYELCEVFELEFSLGPGPLPGPGPVPARRRLGRKWLRSCLTL